MRTILGVLAVGGALCLMPWALPAQVRADSSAVIVLASNETDNEFTMWVKKGAEFQPVGLLTPHTNMVWVIPSRQLSPKDSLAVIMWILKGTHSMQSDTITRKDGVVNIYRRDFRSGKPEAREG